MRTRLRPLLVIALLATGLVGCSRPPDLVGIDNPTIPAESVSQVSRHRLFITTTRKATEVVGPRLLERPSPELGLASVDVTVPPNHVAGHLERPEHLPPDPRTEFAVVDPVIYRSDASFIPEINRELAPRPVGQRKLLIFVHGYNNTTSSDPQADAVRRGHRLSRRAGALYLGLRRQDIALCLRSQQCACRSRRDSRKWRTSSPGRGPRT